MSRNLNESKILYNKLMSEAVSAVDDDMAINDVAKHIKRGVNEGMNYEELHEKMFSWLANVINDDDDDDEEDVRPSRKGGLFGWFKRKNNHRDMDDDDEREGNEVLSDDELHGMLRKNKVRKEKVSKESVVSKLAVKLIQEINSQSGGAWEAMIPLKEYVRDDMDVTWADVVDKVYGGLEKEGYQNYIGYSLREISYDIPSHEIFLFVSAEDTNTLENEQTNADAVILCDTKKCIDEFKRNKNLKNAVMKSAIPGYGYNKKDNKDDNVRSLGNKLLEEVKNFFNNLSSDDAGYFIPYWKNYSAVPMKDLIDFIYGDFTHAGFQFVVYRLVKDDRERGKKMGDRIYAFVKTGEGRKTGDYLMDNDSSSQMRIYKKK